MSIPSLLSRIFELSFTLTQEQTKIAIATMRRSGYASFFAKKCGHLATRSGVFYFDGGIYHVDLSLDEHGVSDWCTECVKGMSIRCAVTGKPIMIGDTVCMNSLCACGNTGHIVQAKYADGKERGVWVPGNDGKGTVALLGEVDFDCLPKIRIV